MEKIIIFLINLIVSVVSAQSNIDVLHYKFNIGLNDVNDTIHGVAEIKVRFLQPANNVSFDFKNPDASGKGMKAIMIPDKNVKEIKQAGEKIILILSHQYKAGDSATFVISYSGIPSDGLIISKTKYGRRCFFADNWPNHAHYWIPCHDDPADKASVEFIVTVPEHYQVVANGIQVEDSSFGNGFKLTHWNEETPISTKVMAIGAADFSVTLSGKVNGIPVYSYVYPENKEKGFYDYAQANEILQYYISTIGPYGFKKLANVQSNIKFSGLENANTIFYSENSVTGTRRSESLLAHEIAHQWFGNMATEKSFGHLWLSEGFATYFNILYFENKYGKDTAHHMLKEERNEVIDFSKINSKSVVDTTESDYMNLLNSNSYQKGAWVLHMLRCELGDTVFFNSIRKYYATYSGLIAGTEELQKVFEEASGKNLKQFFQQWLYTACQPDLDIVWDYHPQKKEINITVTQVQPKLFSFPLELFIRSSNEKERKVTLTIDQKKTMFTFPASEKPIAVLADKDVKLLTTVTLHPQ